MGIFHKLANISWIRNAPISNERLNPPNKNFLICLTFNSAMSIKVTIRVILSPSKIIFLNNLAFSIYCRYLPSRYYEKVKNL